LHILCIYGIVGQKISYERVYTGVHEKHDNCRRNFFKVKRRFNRIWRQWRNL